MESPGFPPPPAPKVKKTADIKAYQKAYREAHPNYWREWAQRPKNQSKVLKTADPLAYQRAYYHAHKPPPSPPINRSICPKCSGPRKRNTQNQWDCPPCRSSAYNARPDIIARRLQRAAKWKEKSTAKEAARAAREAKRSAATDARTAAKLHRIPKPPPTLKERFNSKITKTDSCWLWLGRRGKGGYGKLSFQKKKLQAHRVSFLLHYGFLDDSLQVHHSCDNPPCVNPAHLSQGNHFKNMREAAERHRVAFNERNTQTKLSVPQVEEIVTRRFHGESIAALARKFQIAERTAGNIAMGRTRVRITQPLLARLRGAVQRE